MPSVDVSRNAIITRTRAPEARSLSERFPALARFRERLGNTRLIQVPAPDGGASIFAKCEMENPAGSIKDRTAYALLAPVLERTPDDELADLKILEYSGGTLARALARLCNELGIPVRLVLSSASPPSLIDQLTGFGADVRLVDKELGFYAVIEEAIRLSADRSWTFLYQHKNQANLDFHTQTTGAEIVAQLAGRRPDAWVASIGTGGTLMGVARALRRANPNVAVYGCTPAELPYGSDAPPNGLPKYAGAGGFGNGLKQHFVEPEEHLLAGQRSYTYEEALKGMALFYDLTGLRIGGSAAANWLASREIARTMSPSDTVVTVFPCGGTPEEWRRLGRIQQGKE